MAIFALRMTLSQEVKLTNPLHLPPPQNDAKLGGKLTPPLHLPPPQNDAKLGGKLTNPLHLPPLVKNMI